MTVLEFEVEHLKDEKVEKEEEVRKRIIVMLYQRVSQENLELKMLYQHNDNAVGRFETQI